MGTKRTKHQRPDSGPRFVIYARTSTVRQDVGLDVQLDAAKAWVATTGGAILATYSEQVSGGRSNADREQFAKALRHACEERATLLFYKLDRFGRTLRDIIENAETIAARGANFVSLRENIDTSTAVGKLYFHMLGALSQWERETIAERTSAALQSKKSRGERVGRIPYGYRLKTDGRHDESGRAKEIERDPEAYSALEEIDRLAQSLSYADVAARLNDRGIKPPFANTWSKMTAYRAHQSFLKDACAATMKRT